MVLTINIILSHCDARGKSKDQSNFWELYLNSFIGDCVWKISKFIVFDSLHALGSGNIFHRKL